MQTCSAADGRVRKRVPGVGDEMSKALRRLLSLKDEAHYGMLYVSRQKTTTLRNARRMVELAERATLR